MTGSAERKTAAPLKEALARFPSGVVIATTTDADGTAKGFTASSFSSVSMDPPLVMVCIDRAAESYAAFQAADRFAINLLRPRHESLAKTFATRGADKFGVAGFAAEKGGLPILTDALAVLVCRLAHDFPCGDHNILVGAVETVDLGPGTDAMVYYRRRFLRLDEPASNGGAQAGNLNGEPAMRMASTAST